MFDQSQFDIMTTPRKKIWFFGSAFPFDAGNIAYKFEMTSFIFQPAPKNFKRQNYKNYLLDFKKQFVKDFFAQQ